MRFKSDKEAYIMSRFNGSEGKFDMFFHHPFRELQEPSHFVSPNEQLLLAIMECEEKMIWLKEENAKNATTRDLELESIITGNLRKVRAERRRIERQIRREYRSS